MGAAARLAAPPAEAIEVLVFDVPPGRRVERIGLIDAQGGRHDAETLVPVTRTEGGTEAGPSIGIAVTGGSSSGITPSLTLGWSSVGAEVERTSRRVAARVPIPDPTAYRANGARWRIEVDVVEIDGARRTLSFPAGAN